MRQSVESVLNQTRFDLIEEIIIVDDGSIDNTRNIIFEIKDEVTNCPIKYIYQNNSGPSCARNTGIKSACAEWIALLDADDIWLPMKIERQFEVISNNSKIKFLGSHYPLRVLFLQKHGLVKLNAYKLCIRSMPYTPSVIFERKMGLDFGLFNEKYTYNEDAEFFQKFLLVDSYYVLAEHLIEIDVGKEYYGEMGLSSNFREMYAGKKRNMRWLCEQALINKPYYWLMCVLCDIKLFRRIVIQSVMRNLKGVKSCEST